MKLSLETVARLYAAGRNYANMAIGFAASLGLISAAQSKTLTESLSEVWAGISQIVHGLTSIWQVLVIVGGPFVGAVLAWYAQRSAKTDNKAASITKEVPGTIVVTTTELAKATPDAPNVVSKDEVRVVNK